MRLPFAAAQLALSSHAPDDSDILKDRINRAHERIILDGKFNGSTQRIAISALFGNIPLPRHYRTIEGVKVNGVVTTLTNGWYEFLEGKGSAMGFDMNNVRSLGDGWATMNDVPLLGDLTASDDLVLFGEDANAMPIRLELAATTPTANPFTTIARVSRVAPDPAGNPVTLTHTSTDAVVTTLALMEPNEKETFFRRYRLDNYINVSSAVVEALVKRRHIELTQDDDLLFITNITALGWAMDSLQYMAENDHTVADGYHNRAVALLNNELQDGHSVDEVPTIKLHYPGKTEPRFQSFY